MVAQRVEQVVVGLITVVIEIRRGRVRSVKSRKSANGDRADWISWQEPQGGIPYCWVKDADRRWSQCAHPAIAHASNIDQGRTEDVSFFKGDQDAFGKHRLLQYVKVMRSRGLAVVVHERAVHRVGLRESVVDAGKEEVFTRDVLLN